MLNLDRSLQQDAGPAPSGAPAPAEGGMLRSPSRDPAISPGAARPAGPAVRMAAPWPAYAVALGLTLAALVLRLALQDVMPNTSPFLFFMPAVMFSAWYGGLGPGLLSTFVGALAANYFLLKPGGAFAMSPDNVPRVLLFVVIGVQISWLSGALRRARILAETDAAAARRSERRYRALSSNFPNGAVFLFDRELRWLLADGKGLDAAGVDKQRLAGRPIAETVPAEVARAVEPMARGALEGRDVVAEVSHAGRVYLVHALPLGSDGEVPTGMAIALDVTERVRVREALRQANEQLERRVAQRTGELAFQKSLLESQSDASLDGILVVSPERQVMYLNRRFLELWQLAARPLPAPLDGVVEEMRSRLAVPGDDPLAQARAPYPCPDDRPHSELVLKDEQTLECYSAPVVGPDGTDYGHVWFFRDVTERKRLARQVLEVCEREQRRIGQDLHDGLGQQLTGIGLLAMSLGRKLREASPAHAADAEEIAEMMRQAVTQARDLARGLRPVALAADGFVAALNELANVVSKTSGLSVELRHGDGEIVPPDDATATHLYRIAQESVSNAIRHGRPSRIDITLARTGDAGLRLTIEDDGAGLPQPVVKGQGMGLQIMQHRARLIGAVLEVRRGSEGGTLVDVSLPRHAEAARS